MIRRAPVAAGILRLSVSVFLLTLPAAYGQAVSGSPQFEVASVRGVQWRQGAGSSHTDEGRIDYRQVGLKTLVFRAYPVAYYQIVWPAQAGNPFFDVSATFPPGTTKEQLQLMLRGLLADRFRFSAHWETRDMKVYALEISDRGLKIHKAANPPDADHAGWIMGSYKGEWYLGGRRLFASESDPSGITMISFLDAINENSMLDRILFDKTGLEGFYDIQLTVPRDVDAGSSSNRPDGPTLIHAMEKQLGLKVEKQTVPVQMLVVDRVETVPTEN